ncbi:MAG: ATP-dependent zinc metalloprotease FtsH [Clostridiales bacterium]|nr:ATP-dependent zinc metalloprotease FtsH [Clostridiales bacterium]MCR5275240.1 ATP-dependent zinc metalloprotease FtsH [Clostridiales bacterium]
MSQTEKRPKRSFSGLPFYLVLIVILIVASYFFLNGDSGKSTSLSEALNIIQSKDTVAEDVVLNGNTLSFKYMDAETGKKKEVSKKVPYDSQDHVLQILMDAEKDGAIESFEYKQPTDVSAIMSGIMIVLMIAAMIFIVWINFSRNQGEGRSAMNFGRSKAKLHDPSKNKVNFADVAGADEEKEELAEVVDFLKNPKKYSALGAKIPKGILLHGAPGTGKTLLAKAVAGEAGVPFFSISGSDFVEMFVGVGASRVRDLFDSAKKNSPCIVFIDEIDAVGRHRGAGMGGGHDEREQTLNQLLVEMDGFGPNEGVIVIAATNRVDILDPALLRPGRFDRRVSVARPDIKGRADILKVHAKNKPFEDDVDLKEIAKITPGYTGADLANLLNEAALLAARRNAKKISKADVSEAVFKVMVGPEKKSRVITDKEKRLTAFHEAGHAIVLRTVSETEHVERVSIIPAGGAGGYTAHKPDEDIYYTTKKQLIDSIMISLGGRAAEQIILGEISTGASSDLQHCNGIAREMITRYGMSEKFPNVIFDDDDEVFIGKSYGHTRVYSEQSAAAIDEEIARIIDKAYNDVLDLLNEKMVILNAVANRLLEKEKIEGPEFEQIYVSGGVIPASEETPAEEEKTSVSEEENASENAAQTTEEKIEETSEIEKAVEELEKRAETSETEEKKDDQ